MAVYGTGDTHIPFDVKKLNSKNFKDGRFLTKEDYLIITGDFGLIWRNIINREETYWLKWFTNEKKFTTLFIDGNHDNHKRLHSWEVVSNANEINDVRYKTVEKFGGIVGKISDSIFHLRRGGVYTICGKKFFIMGGANSIDKHMRIKDLNWWEEEEPNMMEINYGLDNLEACGNSVDYILGHTAPKSVILETISSYYKCGSASRFLDHIVKTVEFKEFYLVIY